MLWVDKHRPGLLDKLDYHEELTSQLRRMSDKENVHKMSHLLVYGPSGAGKKTRVMALLREVSARSVSHESNDTPLASLNPREIE
jgi:replication factor C subunit 3/5